MKTYRKCVRCRSYVKRETVKGLRREYPFYCPTCDENMYRFETMNVKRQSKKGR